MKKLNKLIMAALVAAMFLTLTLAACGKTPPPLQESDFVDEPSVEEVDVIHERDDIPTDAVEIGGYKWVELPDDPREGDTVGYDLSYTEGENALNSPYGYDDVTVFRLSASGELKLAMSGFNPENDFALDAEVVKYLTEIDISDLSGIFTGYELNTSIRPERWGWQIRASFRDENSSGKVTLASPSDATRRLWRESFMSSIYAGSFNFADVDALDLTSGPVTSKGYFIFFNTQDVTSLANIEANYRPDRHGGVTSYAVLIGDGEGPEAWVTMSSRNNTTVGDPYGVAAQVAEMLAQ
ncbi:MAG: hypothetical protein LBH36_00360 [Candidatus Nomurabacteria bacterium]|jgi:hypothetical protein|nr:hypothetical protein [Candidatus Nomurabacteria bacterium]